MKENFIHVCFIIDESGSMTGTEADVIGGFKKVIDEQKANTSGTCSISYYKFADRVDEVYRGKDVNEVEYIDKSYSPGGCTALFDAIGTAIDKIGKWLNDMPEEERPEKNLIVIMTDGGENSSREYNGKKVKEMIKHQEEKYNWSFIYMGSDLTDADDANVLGISTRLYSAKSDYSKNYDVINTALNCYRSTFGDAGQKGEALNMTLCETSFNMTSNYATKKGIDVNDLLDNSSEKA